MSQKSVIDSVSGGIATLVLNRPEKRNALSEEMVHESISILKAWSRDSSIGTIIITGAGPAFCAGGDISKMATPEIEARTLEQRIDGLQQRQELSWLLHSIPKVTIAAVNGFAVGAGLGICLACDLRIASDKAGFGTAYANVGLSGDFGTTWLLTQYVGAPKAKELLFLPDIIGAEEAYRLGLVNRVVPHRQLEESVREIAERIAHGPHISHRYNKANVNLAATADFRTAMDREAETHQRCCMSDDHKDGVRAFLEKRSPVFRGK
jgi:2-(1,2-epoxy-1,2-dihydrophenyl)acetyl-CoA isomerase